MAGLSGLGSWARMLYLYQPDLYRTWVTTGQGAGRSQR